jgi:hypothetical protein
MARARSCAARAAIVVGCALGAWVGPSVDAPKSAWAAAGPTVRLNRLRLPDNAATHERFLRKLLERQARKLDWGAGTGSVIEYRFVLQRLDVTVENDVLTVHCAAVGSLPKGLTARSQLSFGGEPKEQTQLVKRVLSIVAHGVLTRLAELERERRAKP